MKSSGEYKAVAVIDTIEDRIIPQSLELLAFIKQIYKCDFSDILLVVAGRNTTDVTGKLAENYGIDIAAAEHDDFYYPNPSLLIKVLYSVIEKYNPEVLCFTHTIRNCSAAAALSALFTIQCITGVETFSEKEKVFEFQRSMFNGKLKENVRVTGQQVILTINPGAFELSADYKFSEREASIETTGVDPGIHGYKPLSLSENSDIESSIEDADVIIAAGRGIGKPENLQMVKDMAQLFDNAAIGASRPVCDNKWLPYRHQVGVTGKTVSPKLYMALGISGSQQHIVGMKKSQCIVAVNRDPNASIFSVADYIVVEDLAEFLPVFITKYNERNG